MENFWNVDENSGFAVTDWVHQNWWATSENCVGMLRDGELHVQHIQAPEP